MKRISTILLFLFLATTLKAQNLVSTDPYKRNAVIEEYTGIYCGYCPDGHRIANELSAKFQDRLFVLNIHAGSYATDASVDFRTEDGNVIFAGSKVSSFPSGNVNRIANKAVGRDLWNLYVEQQVEQMAECNVAGQVIIDKESRKATVTVEVYYTANSISETNYLNVMMLQNNILAYQNGGYLNPSQVVGGQYRHMHAFRDAITPAWGEEITPTTAGTFITKTYEYDIPSKIGSFDVNIDDLEFVAFVTETKNEDQSTSPILNANKLHYISAVDENVHPTILSVGASSAISCSETQPVDIIVNNSGLAELTSLKFELSVDNAEPIVKTWEGNVASGQTFKVTFDIDVAEGTHDVNVKIVEANGEKYEESKNLSVKKEGWVEYKTESAETEMTIEVVQDKYGSQITWELIGSDYSVLASGGPYENLKGSSAIELHRVNVKVPMGECVKFVIKDSKSNGICCQYGDGFYRILNSKGKVIVNGAGDFGAEASCVVSIVEGVEEEPEPEPENPGLKAQNLVSTDPYKRNVIIEEYTGVYCGYCPDGHKIANELAAEYQDRLFVLNIHAGGYANDASIDFRTEDGNIIFNGAKANSFPSGNVNRAANKAVSRDLWRAYVEQQVEQMAECNVAGQVIIDKESRKATVTVEVYYTANSISETNYLNVMMLQNNILAYQSGDYLNPDQVVGGKYRHMHAFRDAITPAWGEEITPTTAGTFITKTYEYDIPSKIGSFDVNIDDLEFVAFVTETKNEDESTTPVLNANKLHYISAVDENIHPTMLSVGASSAFSCSATQPMDIVINNSGVAELTSLKFEVSVDNAEPVVKTWEGNAVPGQTFKVAFNVDMTEGSHNVNVKIVEANGEEYEESKSLSVKKEGWVEYKTESAETEMTIEVVQDKYGSQITWELLGSDYSVLASGGPYENLKGQVAIELHRTSVKVPMGECVKFVIKDSKSNGICCQYGDGFYRILNSKGKVIVNGAGDFGAEASCVVSIVEGVEEEPEPENPGEGIEEVTSSVKMYPNPVSDKLYIEAEMEVEEVVVYTITGVIVGQQTTDNGQQSSCIDVTNLNSGIYFVKVKTANGEIVKRFIKN